MRSRLLVAVLLIMTLIGSSASAQQSIEHSKSVPVLAVDWATGKAMRAETIFVSTAFVQRDRPSIVGPNRNTIAPRARRSPMVLPLIGAAAGIAIGYLYGRHVDKRDDNEYGSTAIVSVPIGALTGFLVGVIAEDIVGRLGAASEES